MIEFSWGHILVIALVALIVIGPKELPTVLRTTGQWMGKIRRMAVDFQGQFQEAMREAENGRPQTVFGRYQHRRQRNSALRSERDR